MALLYGRALRHAEDPVNAGESGPAGTGSGGFVAGPGDRERGTQRDEKELSSLAEGYRKAAPFIGASTSLVVAVGVFLGIGWWVDKKLGNRVPWFTMLGALIGMTGGFISFFKTVLGATRNRRP
jgi:ATP synthase protein I